MIEVKHLTKLYGEHTAVSDLSFTTEDGRIYGFLGPNGAGKSTTMNIMTGCLAATSGDVRIDGHDIFEDANEAKKLIGYLPEQPPLYIDSTPREYLQFVAEAKRVAKSDIKRQIAQVMEVTQITDVADRLIRNLSKGYRQRVGIAQALLGDPKVIILDEPTVGLDPLQIIEIRDLIRQLGQEHTVILSSHILSEVQAICEKVLIIAHGRLVAFDEPDQLERSLLGTNEISFTTDAPPERVRSILAGVPHVFDIKVSQPEKGLVRAQMQTNAKDIYDTSREVFFAFAKRDIALLELNLKKASLEDIFIELTEGGVSAVQTEASVPAAESEANDQ